MDAMLNAAAEFLKSIDPELSVKPIYLVDDAGAGQVSPLLRCGSSRAWTSMTLDLQLHPLLVHRMLWRGRGFASVVRLDGIKTAAELLGSVLHEAAHYFSNPAPKEVSETRAVEVHRTLLDMVAEQASKPAAQKPRWYSHEVEFLRAAAHLAYRARHSVKPTDLNFARPYYGAKLDESKVMNMLYHEIVLNEKNPIREVLATDPPKWLVDAWNSATQVAA